MGRQGTDRSSGGGAALFLLVAVIGGAVWYSNAPQSFRPPQPSLALEVGLGTEPVNARLWQDPFAAVAEHRALVDSARSAAREDEPAKGEPAKGEPGWNADAAGSNPGTQDEAQGDDASPGLQALRTGIQEHEGKLLVLPVLVPGDSYTSSIETRLRTRTAVVSAMHAQQFHPLDREHLGFATLSADLSGAQDAHQPSRTFDLPFEWYACDTIGEPTRSDYLSVLVLWVDERYLGERPLAHLDGLLAALQAPPVSAPPSRSFDVTVLGPTSSNILKQMLLEDAQAGRTRAEADRDGDAGLRRILNYRATAPEALLLQSLNGDSSGGGAAPSFLVASNDDPGPDPDASRSIWAYERTISGDEELLLALVFELSLRGVDLWGDSLCGGDDADAVVLVGEFDTFYGRAFPVTWEAAVDFVGTLRNGELLRDLLDPDGEPQKRTPEEVLALIGGGGEAAEAVLMAFRESLPKKFADGHKAPETSAASDPRLVRFSYLRGLDGAAPGLSNEDSRAENAKRGDAEHWQEPVGTSQLDFVGRLTRVLSARGNGYGDRERRAVGAIGIVGTDPYDKQLILQALRVHMQGTPVFSTDLDARLLHESQYTWSRNLILASGFGLELNAHVQKNISPFRGVYQTAAFLSAQLAIGGADVLKYSDAPIQDGVDAAGVEHFDDKEPAPPEPLIPRELLRPRLFEVARNGALDLTPSAFGSKLHPTAGPQAPNHWRIVLVGVAALLLLLATSRLMPALSVLWHGVGDFEKGPWQAWLRGLFLLTGSCLAGTAFVLWRFGGQAVGTGEPLTPFEGVSVWPSIIIRLVVFNLCAYGIILGVGALERNSRALQRRFGLEGVRLGSPSWREWGRGWLWNLGLRGQLSAQVSWSVQSVWNDYCSNGRRCYTVGRVLILAVLYCGLAGLLFYLFGLPHSPVRGAVARNIDALTTALSVFPLVALILFIVDVTRECERLVSFIARRQSSWPAVRCPARGDRQVLDEEAVKELLDVQFVAGRTKAVDELIVLPFIALLLLIVSRTQLFDGFDWPPALLVVLGMHTLFSICSAVRLRRAAERVRSHSLRRLADRLTLHLGGCGELASATAAQVRELIDEIEGVSVGAFAPWSRSPALRALLMPFGGVGALALIDMLAKSGA
ncbi:MAG: hypothetical protein DRQ55_07155 [Planctomycetota bacterium]|nr:MAG: hypothetical protein DRQ55_07155 [Planctomycetota bacterium]